MTMKKSSKKSQGAKSGSAKKGKTHGQTSRTVSEAMKTRTLVKRQGVSIWDASSIIVTFFSAGRIPLAPGTWGSLMGVVFFPFFLLLPLYVSRHTDQVILVAITGLAILTLLYSIGILAIKDYQSKTKIKDGPEIVYDEFFGQILTYSIISVVYCINVSGAGGFTPVEITPAQKYIVCFAPFLFFRLFDVCKPWPINLIDKNDNSARGVMLDDILAAFYASAASIVAFIWLDNFMR
jgi:phosphatidylglycerophosphatase A